MLSLKQTILFLTFALLQFSSVKSQGCSTSILDLGVILDSSGSIGSANYDQARAAVIALVDRFNVAAGKIHFGLINYSDQIDRVVSFVPSEQVKTLVKSKVQQMPYIGGGTPTAEAIRVARESLFAVKRGEYTPRIAIVFTDGASNEGLAAVSLQAKLLKETGVEMFAIGIGSNINKAELGAIASYPQNVLYIANYQQIIASLNTISQVACDVNVFVPLNKEVNIEPEKNELRYFVSDITTVNPATQYIELNVVEKVGFVSCFGSLTEKNPNETNSIRMVPSQVRMLKDGSRSLTYIFPIDTQGVNFFYSLKGLADKNEFTSKVSKQNY